MRGARLSLGDETDNGGDKEPHRLPFDHKEPVGSVRGLRPCGPSGEGTAQTPRFPPRTPLSGGSARLMGFSSRVRRRATRRRLLCWPLRVRPRSVAASAVDRATGIPPAREPGWRGRAVRWTAMQAEAYATRDPSPRPSLRWLRSEANVLPLEHRATLGRSRSHASSRNDDDSSVLDLPTSTTKPAQQPQQPARPASSKGRGLGVLISSQPTTNNSTTQQPALSPFPRDRGLGF